ncbi:hypothetical protein [Fimbriiglobus ruber]|uniref:Phage protein n=1 Tax=Fimbriiglobus ruber TaxID=1908690 RepID=A0A225DI88_9BACT|nr:hypothetical protein [Fimbriiglobus ruber]OWK36889.1 Phage protein [Fimbriiglobus ruber]
MVQTFGTNLSGDIYLGADGNLAVLSGIQAIAGACVTACRTQLGECVLQTGVGLPNFQTVWVGVPDYALWQSYLQNTLLAVEGVTAVQSVNLTALDNVLRFTAEIQTIYGSTVVNG